MENISMLGLVAALAVVLAAVALLLTGLHGVVRYLSRGRVDFERTALLGINGLWYNTPGLNLVIDSIRAVFPLSDCSVYNRRMLFILRAQTLHVNVSRAFLERLMAPKTFVGAHQRPHRPHDSTPHGSRDDSALEEAAHSRICEAALVPLRFIVSNLVAFLFYFISRCAVEVHFSAAVEDIGHVKGVVCVGTGVSSNLQSLHIQPWLVVHGLSFENAADVKHTRPLLEMPGSLLCRAHVNLDIVRWTLHAASRSSLYKRIYRTYLHRGRGEDGLRRSASRNPRMPSSKDVSGANLSRRAISPSTSRSSSPMPRSRSASPRRHVSSGASSPNVDSPGGTPRSGSPVPRRRPSITSRSSNSSGNSGDAAAQRDRAFAQIALSFEFPETGLDIDLDECAKFSEHLKSIKHTCTSSSPATLSAQPAKPKKKQQVPLRLRSIILRVPRVTVVKRLGHSRVALGIRDIDCDFERISRSQRDVHRAYIQGLNLRQGAARKVNTRRQKTNIHPWTILFTVGKTTLDWIPSNANPFKHEPQVALSHIGIQMIFPEVPSMFAPFVSPREVAETHLDSNDIELLVAADIGSVSGGMSYQDLVLLTDTLHESSQPSTAKPKDTHAKPSAALSLPPPPRAQIYVGIGSWALALRGPSRNASSSDSYGRAWDDSDEFLLSIAPSLLAVECASHDRACAVHRGDESSPDVPASLSDLLPRVSKSPIPDKMYGLSHDISGETRLEVKAIFGKFSLSVRDAHAHKPAVDDHSKVPDHTDGLTAFQYGPVVLRTQQSFFVRHGRMIPQDRLGNSNWIVDTLVVNLYHPLVISAIQDLLGITQRSIPPPAPHTAHVPQPVNPAASRIQPFAASVYIYVAVAAVKVTIAGSNPDHDNPDAQRGLELSVDRVSFAFLAMSAHGFEFKTVKSWDKDLITEIEAWRQRRETLELCVDLRTRTLQAIDRDPAVTHPESIQGTVALAWEGLTLDPVVNVRENPRRVPAHISSFTSNRAAPDTKPWIIDTPNSQWASSRRQFYDDGTNLKPASGSADFQKSTSHKKVSNGLQSAWRAEESRGAQHTMSLVYYPNFELLLSLKRCRQGSPHSPSSPHSPDASPEESAHDGNKESAQGISNNESGNKENNHDSAPLIDSVDVAAVSTSVWIHLDLFHLYMALMAARVLQTLKPKSPGKATESERPRAQSQSQREPSRSVHAPLIITFNKSNPMIHIFLGLPNEDDVVYLNFTGVRIDASAAAGLRLEWDVFTVCVSSPLEPGRVFSKIMSLNKAALHVRKEPGGYIPLAVSLSARSARITIPYSFVLSHVLDNGITFIKACKLLVMQVLRGYKGDSLHPEPEGIKKLPKIELRILLFLFEFEDDPFEERLSLVLRCGLAEQMLRLHRQAALDKKRADLRVKAEEEREAARGSNEASFDAAHVREEHRGRWRSSSSARSPPHQNKHNKNRFAQQDERLLRNVQERLDRFNSQNWINRINNAILLRRKREDMLDTRLYGDAKWLHEDEGQYRFAVDVAQRTNAKPLARMTIAQFHITASMPEFEHNGGLAPFLSRVGEGMPADKLDFSLLVAVRLKLEASEIAIHVRDYPLPALHVPSYTVEPQTFVNSKPSWSMESDFVVAEEMCGDDSLRHLPCEVIPASETHDAKARQLTVLRTGFPVKLYSDPIVHIHTEAPTLISWAKCMHALSDITRIFDTLSRADEDPSVGLPGADKLRLKFHIHLQFWFEGPGGVELLLKSSHSPYALTGSAAGFVMAWRGGVKFFINQRDGEHDFFNIESDSYALAVPDLMPYQDLAVIGGSSIVKPKSRKVKSQAVSQTVSQATTPPAVPADEGSSDEEKTQAVPERAPFLDLDRDDLSQISAAHKSDEEDDEDDASERSSSSRGGFFDEDSAYSESFTSSESDNDDDDDFMNLNTTPHSRALSQHLHELLRQDNDTRSSPSWLERASRDASAAQSPSQEASPSQDEQHTVPAQPHNEFVNTAMSNAELLQRRNRMEKELVKRLYGTKEADEAQFRELTELPLYETRETPFKLVVAKLRGGVRWGLGSVSERTCTDATCSVGEVGETPFHRRCRFLPFIPHWEVHPRVGGDPDIDSYEGFRSQFQHMSISLTSPLPGWKGPAFGDIQGAEYLHKYVRDEGDVTPDRNSIHIPAVINSHFMAWWRTFDSSMALPIRQGPLFPSLQKELRPKSPRIVATIRHKYYLAPVSVSQTFVVPSWEDWNSGSTSQIGLKAKGDVVDIDLLQRSEESTISRPEWPKPRTVVHKAFYRAQVDLVAVDVRIVGITFDEKLKADVYPNDVPAFMIDHAEMPLRERFKRATKPTDYSVWTDPDDFEDYHGMLRSNITSQLVLPVAFCPHFAYSRSHERDKVEDDQDTRPKVVEVERRPSLSDDGRGKQGHKERSNTVSMATLPLSKFGNEAIHVKGLTRSPIREVLHAQKLLFEKRRDAIIQDDDYPPQEKEKSLNWLERALKVLDVCEQRVVKSLHEREGRERGHDTVDDSPIMVELKFDKDGTTDFERRLPIMQMSPETWSSWLNRYLVQSPLIRISGLSRDMLQLILKSRGTRSDFMYFSSVKAIKVVDDLMDMQQRRAHEERRHRQHSHPAMAPKESQDEEASASSTESQPFDDTLSCDMDEVINEMGRRFSIDRAHQCMVVNPHIVLAPLADDSDVNSCLQVTAYSCFIGTYRVNDPVIAQHDLVNAHILHQTFVQVESSQIFYPRKSVDMSRTGRDLYFALEVPPEFSCDCRRNITFGYERIADRTNFAVRMDRFNRLQVRSQRGASVDESLGQHFVTQTNRTAFNTTGMNIRLNRGHYLTVYNAIQRIILFTSSSNKQSDESLKALVISQQFGDLGRIKEYIEYLQMRYRATRELWIDYAAHVKLLSVPVKRYMYLCFADSLFYGFHLNRAMRALVLYKQFGRDATEVKTKKSDMRQIDVRIDHLKSLMLNDRNEPFVEFTVDNIDFLWLTSSEAAITSSTTIGSLSAVNCLPNHTFRHIISKSAIEQRAAPVTSPKKQRSSFMPRLASFGKRSAKTMTAAADDVVKSTPGSIKEASDLVRGTPASVKGAADRFAKNTPTRTLRDSADDTASVPSEDQLVSSAPVETDRPFAKLYLSAPSYVGGIQIIEDLHLSIHPLRVQLEHSVGTQIVDFIFSTRDSDKHVQPVARPTEAHMRHDDSSDEDETLGKLKSFFTSEGQDDDVNDPHLENILDSRVMYNRSVLYRSFVHLEIDQTVLCLSYKASHDKTHLLDAYDVTFRVPHIEHRNQLWSSLEVVDAFKKDALKALWAQKGNLLGQLFRLSHKRQRDPAELATTQSQAETERLVKNAGIQPVHSHENALLREVKAHVPGLHPHADDPSSSQDDVSVHRRRSLFGRLGRRRSHFSNRGSSHAPSVYEEPSIDSGSGSPKKVTDAATEEVPEHAESTSDGTQRLLDKPLVREPSQL